MGSASQVVIEEDLAPRIIAALLIFAIGMALAWGPWFGLRKLAGDRQSKLAWQIPIWLVGVVWSGLSSLVVLRMTLETLGVPDLGQDGATYLLARLTVAAAVLGIGVLPLLMVLKYEATMHRAVHGVAIVAASFWLTVTGWAAVDQVVEPLTEETAQLYNLFWLLLAI